ncbi:SDR family NAD(P)-dependent oxidoreductase [Microvirga puerhi]|uniref:SDR family oxidoreductase n=1 Tax=Microvirga puerhi TaxID=2876078 RepID=A0ABS7VPY9_9HYPH|nr:SDR family oxidoreductase [Microvirga puerhi]MBZ6077621.1 SDR family oxidoreductase [Microvirga puerhi]
MSTTDRFASRIAVVTGAAQGIGRAIADRLAREGAFVYAADRQPEKASTSGLQHLVECTLDVTDPASIAALFHEIEDRHGRCDMLVNNAGIPGELPLHEMTLPYWNNVFAVNVTGQMLMCQAAAPLMSHHGSIVNLSSVAAHLGFADRAAYCASKAAVLGLTRALAVELAPNGIRVNCLCPGTVQTPWIERLVGNDAGAEERRTSLATRQVLNRIGAPEEIAAAVAFLLSEEASFITGSVIMADGGMLSSR